MNIDEEARKATQMLHNKVVDVLWRHCKGEVVLQFSDGTRLFIDRTPDDLELSITEGTRSRDEENDITEEVYRKTSVRNHVIDETVYVR